MDGPLVAGARFGHVNVVARDWHALAAFYVEVFGCTFVPPERDYSGPDLDRGTGLAGTHLRGAHLRFPGHGDTGPTLEIYSYDPPGPDHPGAAADRRGWGHIAFQVTDVPRARDVILARGGVSVGDVVTLETSDGRWVTWCYVTDPEGNVLELQSWS